MPPRNSCARMLATTEGNLRGYALGIRHQLAPGTDQLGAVHAISAVLLLAILGGYQNRTHDPPPGHQIMWRGYERMSIATIGYRIGRRERAGVVQNE